MFKSFAIFIITCLTILSCSKNNDVVKTPVVITAPMPMTDTSTIHNDTITNRTYLALGDSYTIGQSVETTDRFPVQTVKLLQQAGIKMGSPEIIAQTGWTTNNLLSSLLNTAPSKASYDIVTLLIGVNNQYDHLPQKEYADQFLILLNKSIAYAGNRKKRVIVLSIPDYSVTPFTNGSDKPSIARDIDAFNAINKHISDSAGTNYVDVTGFSRLAGNDNSLLASDGLHPSGSQYALWVKALVPVVLKALQ